ncbi:putative intermediate filament protein [Plasmopara halstedii]
MPTELSPIKSKRMEEKPRYRSEHAAEKELETIKQRMQQDLESVRLRLTKELEETRKYRHCFFKLDDEMDQNARLQTLEQEQYKELVKLRAQQTELGNAKVLAETLRVQLERKKPMRHQLRRRSQNRRHSLTLRHNGKRIQDRLQSMEMEVRSHFESVSSSLQNQLDDVQTELDSTKKELDRTATDYEESLKARQALTEKVAQLEREYREVRSKATRDRKAYEETLERFRSSKVAKEREFNELMDVKIALDAEIMKYRRILDREESRVAASTPNTKGRKRKNESTNDVTMKRTNARVLRRNRFRQHVGWLGRARPNGPDFSISSDVCDATHSTLTVHSSKRNKMQSMNAKRRRFVFG